MKTAFWMKALCTYWLFDNDFMEPDLKIKAWWIGIVEWTKIDSFIYSKTMIGPFQQHNYLMTSDYYIHN